MSKLQVRVVAFLVGVLALSLLPASSVFAADKAADVCTAKRATTGQTTIAHGSQPTTLDPMNNIGSVAAVRVGMQSFALFDSLVLKDPKGKYQLRGPADSLKANADFTTWTMKIKPGITFGNGDPVDATATVASLLRVNDPALNAVGRPEFQQMIASITATDPTTVTFALKTGWPAFPDYLARDTGKVVNAKLIAAQGANNFALGKVKGAGIGAYEIDTWIPNESMTMNAKTNWWGGKLCLPSLKFVVLGSDDTQLAALKNGQAAAGFLQDANVIQQGIESGLQFFPLPTYGNPQLFINMRPGYAGNDLRVRQVLQMGLDAEALAKRVFPTVKDKRLVETNHKAVVPKSDPDFNKNMKIPETNPAKAKKLLETIKAEGKFNGKMELLALPTAPSPAQAQAVQAQLNAIGFDITVTLTDQLNTRTNVNHNFDLALATSAFQPYTFDFTLFTSAASSNRSGFCNADFDAQVAKMNTAATHAEWVKALTAATNHFIDEIPNVVLISVARGSVAPKTTHGLYTSILSTLSFDKAYISKK